MTNSPSTLSSAISSWSRERRMVSMRPREQRQPKDISRGRNTRTRSSWNRRLQQVVGGEIEA